MKTIYLAGGCFWGLEKYMSQITGVINTEVGYANGYIDEAPSYELVCSGLQGFAETVKVEYDESIAPLNFILKMFSDAIDPTTVNRQGADRGIQYRSGIYYVNKEDASVIEEFLSALQNNYSAKIAIECKPLNNYFPAEMYHQKYLDKNPNGYCHIGADKFAHAKSSKPEPTNSWSKKSDNTLRQLLTPEQYAVTQQNATEPPFKNAYWNSFEEGIYVDITTGEPLFSSLDKFDSGCGWPAFSRPLNPEIIDEHTDLSHGMHRVEVRSHLGDAHLGHVFTDGPAEMGGLRYCINSASLKFISKADMKKEGYGSFLSLFE